MKTGQYTFPLIFTYWRKLPKQAYLTASY